MQILLVRLMLCYRLCVIDPSGVYTTAAFKSRPLHSADEPPVPALYPDFHLVCSH